MSTKPAYRRDIDGLRAVAVLLVVLYHFGLGPFTGGYIGVDVFFVISGYLITKNIKSDLTDGSFSFRRFYVRRARRLLPALFATIAITFLVAALIFSPAYMQRFAGSALHALFSVSNFYFWSESGYFDAAGVYKPLLHTWSLAVEEQFYLIYPAILVGIFALRARFMPVALASLGALSFWLHTAIPTDPAASFFLLPFRAFEFVIGGLVVWLPIHRLTNWAREMLTVCGLAMIAASALLFTESTPFPSIATLLPCAGAAAVIIGGEARWSGWVLRNHVSTYIGRISYSIYLVHWPLVSFLTYLVGPDFPLSIRIALLAATVLLAMVLYYVVERPFRFGFPSMSHAGVGFSAATACLVLAFPSANAWANGGWQGRVPSTELAVGMGRGGVLKEIEGRLEDDACLEFCELGEASSDRIVLVVGDSHIGHYTKALKAFAETDHSVRYRLIISGSCFFGQNLVSGGDAKIRGLCEEAKETLRTWVADPRVVGVIHGQRWQGYNDRLVDGDGEAPDLSGSAAYYDAMISDVMSQYEGIAGPVVLVGAAPNTNLDCMLRPQFLDLPCPAVSLAPNRAFASRVEKYAAEHADTTLTFVDPASFICPAGECRVLTERSTPAYSDEHHITADMAAEIVPALTAPILRALPQ